jgi:hypothetical protein
VSHITSIYPIHPTRAFIPPGRTESTSMARRARTISSGNPNRNQRSRRNSQHRNHETHSSYEKASEPGEFDHGTVEERKAILERSQKLAKEKLGFALTAFGPHWTATTDATDEALEAEPEIKIWLYGPAKPKYFSRLSIERVMALENPTFVPDPVKFKETYEKIAAKRDVLLLQGHPDQWTDDRWPGFVEIVEFLQSKNIVFMTPSEYLRKTQEK